MAFPYFACWWFEYRCAPARVSQASVRLPLRVHPSRMRVSPAAVALILSLLAAADPATAGQTVLTSRSPYWKVGERDDALSRACALNRFNMERPERLVARFVGKDGPEVLG